MFHIVPSYSLLTAFAFESNTYTLFPTLPAVMKAKTLQIVWHSKEPVFSVDFHPDGYIATGGADKEIKVDMSASSSGAFKRQKQQAGMPAAASLWQHILLF